MFAWTESPRGSRPILLHLPHPLPEIPEDPPQPADPRSPDPGGAGADPSRRRRPGTLLPWEGILTTRPGVPGCDEHVWCGHGQKGRAVTSELATFGRDPAEQAGSGGRPSLLALGGAPSLRPCVLPPTGTMLSTGGQYAVKKRRKPVRKRLFSLERQLCGATGLWQGGQWLEGPVEQTLRGLPEAPSAGMTQEAGLVRGAAENRAAAAGAPGIFQAT